MAFTKFCPENELPHAREKVFCPHCGQRRDAAPVDAELVSIPDSPSPIQRRTTLPNTQASGFSSSRGISERRSTSNLRHREVPYAGMVPTTRRVSIQPERRRTTIILIREFFYFASKEDKELGIQTISRRQCLGNFNSPYIISLIKYRTTNTYYYRSRTSSGPKWSTIFS